MNKNPAEQPLSARTYLIVSAVGLMLVVGLMLFFVYKAPDLVRNGISKAVFYVLLVPLGLSTGTFCFGAMRAYARYRGKLLGGFFELKGPIVVAALVVVGGFYLVPAERPQAKPFSIKVRFIEENGRPVRGGSVRLLLRNATQTRNVDDLGETTFFEIPSEFLNKSAEISYDAPKHEITRPITLDPDNPPRLTVKAKPDATVESPSDAPPSVTYTIAGERIDSPFRLDDFLELALNDTFLGRFTSCGRPGVPNSCPPCDPITFKAKAGDQIEITAVDIGGGYVLGPLWLYKDGKQVRQLTRGVSECEVLGSQGEVHCVGAFPTNFRQIIFSQKYRLP